MPNRSLPGRSEAVVSLPDILESGARSVDLTLERLLPQASGPEGRFHEAMRYAVFNGGKRLRPVLVTLSAAVFGITGISALRTAAAVEMIHCYSLIHDDLPALDNDDLRRGQPTCHQAFDEATAILAGDGLQSLAFEVLADPATHEDADVRIGLVSALASASGCTGMIAGQAIDMAAEHMAIDPPGIRRLQALKTGGLFVFSTRAGAILAKADEASMIAFGRDLGTAFQITDDILDVEGNPEALGKATGKDAAAGKATLVQVLGLEAARRKAVELSERAIDALETFGEAADGLRDMARFAVHRRA
ncbi:MAG: polyprenyl synthetase family protein [Alphaproteobacteria bacterium]|nr:polyprenyl synthetase family protein [Alphaproteobacteria bacterium]